MTRESRKSDHGPAPFVVFEGIDGSGTTTQCDLLVSSLRRAGRSVTRTREPGGTILAEAIRRLLLDPQTQITDAAEMLLYAASRAQHVAELILPSLQRGDVVVSDRFLDSSIAYQGHGRDLGEDLVRQVNEPAIGDCHPGLVVFLDLSVTTARERRVQRGGIPDRMEAAGDAFQEQVARAYRQLASEYGAGALLLDATQSRERLAARVWDEFCRRWPNSAAAQPTTGQREDSPCPA
jgi:dTMP kinase